MQQSLFKQIELLMCLYMNREFLYLRLFSLKIMASLTSQYKSAHIFKQISSKENMTHVICKIEMHSHEKNYLYLDESCLKSKMYNYVSMYVFLNKAANRRIMTTLE